MNLGLHPAILTFYGIQDLKYLQLQKIQVLDDGIIWNDNNMYAFDSFFLQFCYNCVKGLCTKCLSPWILNKISG